jgi:HEAT repeat protein
VIDALGLTQGVRPFPAFSQDFSAAELARARELAEKLRSGLVPVIASLARLPTASFRLLAIEFLAGRSEPVAHDAIVVALDDPERDVRRAALRAAPTADEHVAKAVARRLAVESDWALRVDAAEALGRAKGSGFGVTELSAAAAETHDVNTRLAALRALAAVSPSAAKPLIERAKTDGDAYVRSTAEELTRSAP